MRRAACGRPTLLGQAAGTATLAELVCRPPAGHSRRNFGLVCSIHSDRGKPRVYIRARSLDQFITIVRPYFHDSLLYKLEKQSKK
jgi:hypothetical protein